MVKSEATTNNKCKFCRKKGAGRNSAVTLKKKYIYAKKIVTNIIVVSSKLPVETVSQWVCRHAYSDGFPVAYSQHTSTRTSGLLKLSDILPSPHPSLINPWQPVCNHIIIILTFVTWWLLDWLFISISTKDLIQWKILMILLVWINIS